MLLLHDPDRYAKRPGPNRVIARPTRPCPPCGRKAGVVAIGSGVNTTGPCRLALDLGDWDCFLLAGTSSTIREDEGTARWLPQRRWSRC